MLVKVMFNQRKKGVKITDQRVRITTEVYYFVAGAFFYSFTDLNLGI